MLRRLLMACAGIGLLQTQAFADSQNLGTLTMYLCDDGEDLCSNTLTSAPINLPFGPFTEDFVFDLVNDFPDIPNNCPLVKAIATLETSMHEEFSSATNILFNSSHEQIDINTPFVLNGSAFQAQAETIIYAGTGLYVEVSGFSKLPVAGLRQRFRFRRSNRHARAVDLDNDAAWCGWPWFRGASADEVRACDWKKGVRV